MSEETKHDLLLKRVQVIIAILGGLAALILGSYNLKKNIFTESGPGNLEISVRSDQGRPVAGAHLELYDSQNVAVASSQTPPTGVHSEENLTAGNYILKVDSRGYEPQATATKIEAKKTTRLDIVLRSVRGATPVPDSPIKSALEDVGASWIKRLAKTEEPQETQK